MVALAWSFVALRVVHGLVHLTWNHGAVRGLCFGASNLVLLVLWVQIFLHLRPDG